jgi:uncharacterized integral membrane protein
MVRWPSVLRRSQETLVTTSSSHSPAPSKKSRAIPGPRVIVALVLVVLIVVFVAQNRQYLQIFLFGVTISAPAWLLLTVTALIGVAVGALLRGRK